MRINEPLWAGVLNGTGSPRYIPRSEADFRGLRTQTVDRSGLVGRSAVPPCCAHAGPIRRHQRPSILQGSALNVYHSEARSSKYARRASYRAASFVFRLKSEDLRLGLQFSSVTKPLGMLFPEVADPGPRRTRSGAVEIPAAAVRLDVLVWAAEGRGPGEDLAGVDQVQESGSVVTGTPPSAVSPAAEARSRSFQNLSRSVTITSTVLSPIASTNRRRTSRQNSSASA